MRGFTLVETLIAITLITIAIVAPMALTVESLKSAYYSRDQITASNLAQEAIEAVRSIRDSNILQITDGVTTTNAFAGIPLDTPFKIDAHTSPAQIPDCCTVLKTDQSTGLFGYDPTWTDTAFTRTVLVQTVWSDAAGVPQELRVSVTISWKTGSYQTRQFTISENLYRWVNDN